MGFAVWIDPESRLAWAQGTHEYRPMGTAVIARTDQFRHRDFHPGRIRPLTSTTPSPDSSGSLEDLNATLRTNREWKLHSTPGHLR